MSRARAVTTVSKLFLFARRVRWRPTPFQPRKGIGRGRMESPCRDRVETPACAKEQTTFPPYCASATENQCRAGRPGPRSGTRPRAKRRVLGRSHTHPASSARVEPTRHPRAAATSPGSLAGRSPPSTHRPKPVRSAGTTRLACPTEQRFSDIATPWRSESVPGLSRPAACKFSELRCPVPCIESGAGRHTYPASTKTATLSIRKNKRLPREPPINYPIYLGSRGNALSVPQNFGCGRSSPVVPTLQHQRLQRGFEPKAQSNH
jgi:hypothetical protein